MYVNKDDTELALKFGIVGGTDNPSFELSLRVGEVPSLQLPEVIKIHPKDGYLTAQFPILPTTNKDLQSQSLREVIASTEEHPREGPFTFTPSLQDVTWRRATQDDYISSRLPEEAEKFFQEKDVVVITWKTSDPKTFGFERAPTIKPTTQRLPSRSLLDTFRLIELNTPIETLDTLPGRQCTKCFGTLDEFK